MKFFEVVSAIAAFVTVVSAAPAGYRIPPFVVGRQFFLNGRIQRFAGTNSCGHLSSDTDVDLAASQIASTGYQVTRVWCFGNSNTPDTNKIYYQLLTPNSTTINTGPNGIARLDSAIKHAEKHGLKLVLPLLNNWDDLGGINTYCTAFGCNSTTFYTHPKAQAAYKEWIKFAITRYKSSPAIFSWELMNEPRCRGCSPGVITNWAQDISKYIKSLDPLHLVTLGDEGWFFNTTGVYGDGSYAYSGYEGVDFLANLKIPTLDYGTVHLYPGYWGYTSSWGNQWIKDHVGAGAKAGKPVVLEEYGCQADSEAERGLCSAQWQDTALTAGMAGDQIWQHGTVFPSGDRPGDGFSVFYDLTKGSLYDLLAVQNVKKWAKARFLW